DDVEFAYNTASYLSCEVTTSCSYTDILHLSGQTDAHAELVNHSDFIYSVCCRDTSGFVTLSTACDDAVLLHLSDETNAHVELNNMTDFPWSACLSATGATLSCRYTSAGCSGGETCIATVSTELPSSKKWSNQHIGDCVTAPYETYVCCRAQDYIRTCNSCADCQAKITSSSPDTTVRLVSDITGEPGTCIDVNSGSGVTFDCAGHTISALSGAMIGINVLETSANFTIRNCPNVSYFRYGIRLFHSEKTTVYNTTLYNNTYSGALVMSATNLNFTDVTAYNNGDAVNWPYSGIYLEYVNNSRFTGINTSYNTHNYGFFAYESNNNTLNNIFSSENGWEGVALQYSDNNTLSGITAEDGSDSGIHLFNSSNNLLENLVLNNNFEFGLVLGLDSDNNTISGSTITDNTQG
ncbi:right-handed parallel beta-helix repeat-containing protein, partial [Candidatus Magnetobacterium casense]